jgi:predicted Zn-dependent protease
MLDAGHDSPLLRFSLGELHYKDGAPLEAARHLAAAVRQDPQYSAAWKLYGRALLDAGDAGAATGVLEQGIAVAEARGDNQAAREMQVFLKRARG